MQYDALKFSLIEHNRSASVSEKVLCWRTWELLTNQQIDERLFFTLLLPISGLPSVGYEWIINLNWNLTVVIEKCPDFLVDFIQTTGNTSVQRDSSFDSQIITGVHRCHRLSTISSAEKSSDQSNYLWCNWLTYSNLILLWARANACIGFYSIKSN